MTNTSPKRKLTGKEIFKKGFVLLSGTAFVWFSVAGVIKMMTTPATPPANTQNQEELSPEARLEKEMLGYQLVLDKEPDNVFALEKLVEINLQLGNLSDALPLTEKLVALQPTNQRYQDVLKIIKQGLEAEKTQTPPPSDSSNIPVAK
ncbi:tetratricopeptide repeat protein [Geminocystis sp. CENA526]|uniref:tetratricopeptide repeat protein n=1 Tax=Geminocystis sp. CENA526 TaxID=1355871 RepID=UPI003D6F09C5